MEREEFLKDVIGLKAIKDELFNIVTWFEKSDEYKKSNILTPRGIVLEGNPGNGKSLVLGSLAKCLNVPTYIFPNNTSDIVSEIDSIFKKASQDEKAIIIIDEIDLLLDCSSKSLIKRSLQEHLDGVEKGQGNVMVLAACNDTYWLDEALSREGRFSRVLRFYKPSKVDIRLIAKKIFNEFGIKENELIDDENLITTLEGHNFSEIKGMITDILLRNKNGNITYKDFFTSSEVIFQKRLPYDFKPSYRVCIHEAGHAILAFKFKGLVRPSHICMSKNSGYFDIKSRDCDETFKFSIANIQIAFGGTLAEKLIFKDQSLGNSDDLGKATNYAYKLISDYGYKSFWRTIFTLRSIYWTSDYKLKSNEKVINRLMRQCERKAYRYLKRNKNKLIKLAKVLKEKKFLTSAEIGEIINSNDGK